MSTNVITVEEINGKKYVRKTAKSIRVSSLIFNEYYQQKKIQSCNILAPLYKDVSNRSKPSIVYDFIKNGDLETMMNDGLYIDAEKIMSGMISVVKLLH